MAAIAVILFALAANRMWWALPLIVSVSLVYAATRHEQMGAILAHAARFALWVVGFMVIAFGILWAITFWT